MHERAPRAGILLAVAALLAWGLTSCGVGGAMTPAADGLPDPPSTPSSPPAPDSSPATAPGVVPSLTARGRGDGTVPFDVNDARFMATLTHEGRGNFAVWALDSSLQEAQLLVDVIGPYTGSVLSRIGDWGGLRVIADGRWSLRIRSAGSAPS